MAIRLRAEINLLSCLAMSYARSVLHAVLAFALLLAPMMPKAAQAQQQAAGAVVAIDAEHAHHGHQDASASATTDTACDQHADCDGLCCAVCAHCATAAPAHPALTAFFRPVQTPAKSHLRSTLVASSPNRPPQGV